MTLSPNRQVQNNSEAPAIISKIQELYYLSQTDRKSNYSLTQLF